MSLSRPVLVAGTNGWKPGDPDVEWYEPRSPLCAFFAANDIHPTFGEFFGQPHPFTWSTDLGGVGFGSGDLRVWHAAGINLFCWIVPPLCPDRRIPAAETKLVVHSHGLQVALFACAEGLKIDTLISFGSPIRKDMADVTARARPNIRYWLHVHSDCSDRWQVFGELFDGHLGIVRESPLADRNDAIAKVGHGDLLRNPANFHFWRERGWLDALR